MTQYQDSIWTPFILKIKKLNVDWLIATPKIEWEMYSLDWDVENF